MKNSYFTKLLAKVFKGRAGPPSLFEKVTVALGALAILLFPLNWLIRDPLLLVAYVVAWGSFFFTVQRYECVRCINFECPVNRVPIERRKDFEKKNFGKSFEEMNNLFKKICISGEECRIPGSKEYTFLKINHEFMDFLYWNFVTLTLLSSAGLAIGIHSTVWLLADNLAV